MSTIQNNITGQRLGYRPDEAAEVTGTNRTRIFEAIRQGKLTAHKDGKATIITPEELQRWVSAMPTVGRQEDAPHLAEPVSIPSDEIPSVHHRTRHRR